MSTLTVTEAHEAIVASSKSADHQLRFIAEAKPGEWARQGDCYLLRIAARDMAWQHTDNHQLAPGVSNGSRHVAEDKVLVFISNESRLIMQLPNGKALLLGPQLTCDERFLITHPEHAHYSLPAGAWQIGYQLDFTRQQAVRD